MAKKDLSKILKNGSVRQRLKLLDEYRAGISYGKPSSLTTKELDELNDSFQSPEENRLYNRHLRAYRNYREMILGADGIYGAFKEAIAYIHGFTMLWDTYDRNEEALNSVIAEAQDTKLKAFIAKEFTKQSQFLYADVDVDKEGFIRFYTDNRLAKEKGKKTKEDHSIEAILRIWKERAEDNARQVHTVAKALLDLMEEINYKPTAFSDRLQFLLTAVTEDQALTPKYSKKQMLDLLGTGANSDLYTKYFVYPEPENITVNEEEYNNVQKVLREMIST